MTHQVNLIQPKNLRRPVIVHSVGFPYNFGVEFDLDLFLGLLFHAILIHERYIYNIGQYANIRTAKH